MDRVNDNMSCILIIDLAKPLSVNSRNSIECDIDKDIIEYYFFLSVGNVAANGFWLYLASWLSTVVVTPASLFRFYAKCILF